MYKRLLLFCVVLLAVYISYVAVKIQKDTPNDQNVPSAKNETTDGEESEQYKVYDFSFSKYNMSGTKELEIEGESADMFAKVVKLNNVIAKAYAEDMPVTITADTGSFDKESSTVHLRKNVVATTDDGVRLKTEALDIHADTSTVETDVLAEIEKDDVYLEGVGALCENNFRKITFYKNVKVIVRHSEDADATVVITCDGTLDVDTDKNKATFHDNVIAVDKNGTLKADAMDVYYDKVLKQMKKMYAYGNVVIERGGDKTFCDSAVYLMDEDRVILDGDPEAFVTSADETKQ